jgi:hypothetical protein
MMTMMPYDTYRLYEAERVKHAAEIQCADKPAAQVASAVSWLFRPFTLAVRARAGHPRPPGTAAYAA